MAKAKAKTQKAKSEPRFDAVVKLGTYMDGKDEKGRWQKVGTMMTNPDGEQFLLLNKTFNPAGVNTEEGRDSIIISFFDIDGEEEQE